MTDSNTTPELKKRWAEHVQNQRIERRERNRSRINDEDAEDVRDAALFTARLILASLLPEDQADDILSDDKFPVPKDYVNAVLITSAIYELCADIRQLKHAVRSFDSD